jgi:hypothetical protein
VVLPPGHPADAEAVELARLADARWVATPPGTACRAMLDNACRSAGFVPEVPFHSNDFGVLAAYVATGLGVAMVPGAGTRRLRQRCRHPPGRRRAGQAPHLRDRTPRWHGAPGARRDGGRAARFGAALTRRGGSTAARFRAALTWWRGSTAARFGAARTRRRRSKRGA